MARMVTEGKNGNVIFLLETDKNASFSNKDELKSMDTDPLLISDDYEIELMNRAKALVSGSKTSEVVDIDDWELLEMVLTLDNDWSILGEGQAKRVISKNKFKSSKNVKKESKEGPSPVIKLSSTSSGTPKQEEEDPRTCNVCFANLSSYRSYLLHLQDLHNQFKCPYCPKFITQRSHLYRHIRCVHRDVKNYCDSYRGPICQICFQKFSHRDDLEEHLKGLHDDLDQFKESKEIDRDGEAEEEQEEDALRDSESGETQSEESEEDEDDEIRCQICYKVFQSTLHLRRHKTSVHAQISERVECIYCKKFYSSPELLKTHYERFHKVKSHSLVNKDNSEDDQEEIISEEEEEETFPCPQCSSQLRSPKELRDHLSSRHGFSNEKEDTRSDKKIANTVSNPYECHICHKFLKTKKIHRRHLKNVHKVKLKNVESTKKKVGFKKNIKRSVFSKRGVACFKCDLVVANKSNLKRHLIRIHKLKGKTSIENAMAQYYEAKEHNEDAKKEEPKEELPPIKMEICTSDIEEECDIHEDKVTAQGSNDSPTKPLETSTTDLKVGIEAYVMTSPKAFINFKCRICDIQFNKTSILKRHVLREHVDCSTTVQKDANEGDFSGFQKNNMTDSILRKVELIDCLSELICDDDSVYVFDKKF